MDKLLNAVYDAYKLQDNPGYSDLDNEQPISLTVRTTLGEIRAIPGFLQQRALEQISKQALAGRRK